MRHGVYIDLRDTVKAMSCVCVNTTISSVDAVVTQFFFPIVVTPSHEHLTSRDIKRTSDQPRSVENTPTSDPLKSGDHTPTSVPPEASDNTPISEPADSGSGLIAAIIVFILMLPLVSWTSYIYGKRKQSAGEQHIAGRQSSQERRVDVNRNRNTECKLYLT